MLTPLGKFVLTKKCSLFVAQGSVLDFSPTKPALAGIVNAANEGCLGGGGVDGAITTAGGPNLAADRRALPVLESVYVEDEEPATAMMSDSNDEDEEGKDEPSQPRMYNIRCRTGFAAITGPGEYGSLHTKFVVHAVGPNYYYFDIDQYPIADRMLQSAYIQSLVVAESKNLQQLGFSLLSAGVFRGRRSLKQVLELGIGAIHQYLREKESQENDDTNDSKNNNDDGDSSLEEIVLCGFTERECAALLWVCQTKLGLESLPLPEREDDEMEGPESPDTAPEKRKRDDDDEGEGEEKKSGEKGGKEEEAAMSMDVDEDDLKQPPESSEDAKKAPPNDETSNEENNKGKTTEEKSEGDDTE